jgi:hypothetical protein
MVMEASLRRQLLTHAERLFRDAGDLHFEVGRFSRAAGPGHGVERFPSHLMKLAHAMWVQAKGFDPAPEADSGQHSPVEPGEITHPNDPVINSPVPATASDDDSREEEEVLADLIQHYWQNSHVLAWLPAEAFTAGARRGVYEAIAALARNDEPVDELTVEWQMARRGAAMHATASQAETSSEPNGRRIDPGYVGILAALPVADGTATLTGRTLLNRHTNAQLRDTTDRLREESSSGSPSQTSAVIYAWPGQPSEQQTAGPRQRPAPGASPPPSFGTPADATADRPKLLEPSPGTTSQPSQPGPRPRP